MTAGLLVLPDAEPLLFAGPAGAVRARLHLANHTAERVSVRRAVVTAKGLPATEVPMVAILPPGARCRTTAVLHLPLSTPAGSYSGRVELAGHSWPATVVVLEHSAVSLTPGRVVVSPAGGPVTVVVRNDGSVPLDLPQELVADLGDGILTARLPKAVLLAPGRTAVLALTLALPPGLEAGRRYEAVLPLGPAELTVVVPPHTPVPTRPKSPRRTS